ncbi:MAG: hypothetical protein JXA23_12320 [Bacteroidales bacterium]|nr:hypothetical protein [Bacteroidales bacterium]
MNPEITHHQLSELLEIIQEQYETIRNTQGRIPQIELDILKENIRKFYDQLHLLGKMNTTPSTVGKGHAPTTPAQPAQLVKPVKPVQPTDLDLFAAEEPTFSMKLREAREQTLPPKAEPVEHLKQLININDKFIFINELFDGSLKEYNEAIETLNGFQVKNDAYEYLDLLRKKNLWELGSGTLMKLKEIVERYHA